IPGTVRRTGQGPDTRGRQEVRRPRQAGRQPERGDRDLPRRRPRLPRRLQTVVQGRGGRGRLEALHRLVPEISEGMNSEGGSRPPSDATYSTLFRRMSSSTDSGTFRKASTTAGSKWAPAQRLISV